MTRTIMEWRAILSHKEQELTGTPLPTSLRTDEDREQYQKHMDVLDWIAISQGKINALTKRAKRLWEKSNVGNEFKECTFDSFDGYTKPLQQNKDLCQVYAESFKADTGKGILLYGDYGTGKTHLVTAIANFLVYNYGVSVYFASSPDLFVDIVREGRSYQKTEKPIKELVQTVDVLILDDLGREKSDEVTKAAMFSVIDKRYRAGKPFLITSNLSPQQLSYKLSEACLSRLTNMCEMVQVYGEDYRTANRKSFEEVENPMPF